MKDKKILILSIVGVLMLVSIVVATSYAYFIATVSGNKDTNNVVITNGVMSLEYKDGDEITLDNAVPGSSVTKTFTVKNTGNVATNYTIYFSELSNKFVDKTDLVYTLTSTDGGKSVAQTQVPDSNEAMVSNYEIEAGKTHTYTLTITFLEKNEEQDDNQNVSFKTKVTINETKEYVEPIKFELLGKTIESYEATTDDPDNNIRYFGANPNNYIYFNCSDYSNQSDSTCEKWRIIGIFKNMTKEDGSQIDLVKIIKDERLNNTTIGWDKKQSGIGTSTSSSGSNDWTDSQLMMMLNPVDYLKEGYTVEGNIVRDDKGQEIYRNISAYYNSTTGCHPDVASGSDFTCYSLSFTSTGLKNDLTRNSIESVVWNLGGISSMSKVNEFYHAERGTTVYSGRPTVWTGKVGLMYPSDYGYATAGGTTTNRDKCLMMAVSSWDEANLSDCKNNDYLYKSGYDQWSLTPNISDIFVNGVGFTGELTYSYAGSYSTWGVRPVVYIKSTITLSDTGDGSSSNPYQLNIQ